MKPLKIYMCDLTHDTIVLVSDTIPINIGFIASYAKKIHGEAIAVSLFKYPQTAIDAILEDPPDVLALSNYSWNSNLSERIARLAKAANPQVVTVQGGTNFPHRGEEQLAFLLSRSATDVHTEFEGEVSFSNLVGRILEARDSTGSLFDRPVDGCVFVAPSTRLAGEPILLKGNRPDRVRELDDIPSPYLNGMLDKFFDGRLPPFIETNRGCPFKCSFCHTGADYFRKINMFSIERVCEEIAYIAPRAAQLGITFLHIADTNFGMFPRDRDICEALKQTQEEHGWPMNVVATTGKNNKERVIDITSILGNLFSVTMSVQSMDETVLANIKRSNIKLDHYIAVNKHLQDLGRSSKGEIILGLPGETRESFLRGIEQVIESGVTATTIYSLMLLHGTEFKDPEYRARFEIQGKYRIVPLNYGSYAGERVFDYEEVGVANKDMSFGDYLYLRGFALLVETLHNGRPFEEFFRYGLSLGIPRTDFLRRIADALDRSPTKIRDVVQGFLEETQSELWDGEEELIAHYQDEENYQRLLDGQVGGNLIYKYKSMSVAFLSEAWIDFLAQLAKEIVVEKLGEGAAGKKANAEIDRLVEFCSNKVAGMLDAGADTAPLEMISPYDVVGWLTAEEGAPLAEYVCRRPVRYRFEFSPEQLRVRDDQFKRYGTDVNALSKIVTRISTLESLYRNVLTPEGPQQERRESDREDNTRYALSN